MPFELSQITEFIPRDPLHWLAIAQYLLILMSFVLLSTSGDETPIIVIIMIGALVMLTGTNLYSDQLRIPDIALFLLRLSQFLLPLGLVGFAPTEQARGVAILLTLIALPVMFMGIFGCALAGFADYRSLAFCR
ncbi:MAG: hypothetical protein GYB64_10560 [Chloroflexi bacterium]|nr:hypothetical protein [Chloroflexota bacterium]